MYWNTNSTCRGGSFDPAFDLLAAGTGLAGSVATILFASTGYSLKDSNPNLAEINGTWALVAGIGSLKCLHYGFRNESFPRLLLLTIGRTPKKTEKKKFDFDSKK